MFKRTLPIQYRDREATVDAWATLGHEPGAVSQALNLLSTAFRLSEDDALRLRPHNQIWALYHSYYPRMTGWRRWLGSGPDELEMETLLRDLRKAAPRSATVELPPHVTVAELVKLLEQ